MKIAAIISEYNPFHKGHQYQIDKLREEGFDVIIAIMSGSVVQRGEIACADKMLRAEAAVRCGVDIVLELPAPFSCSSAEFFARAGVFCADAVRADVLSFGSECGDLQLLGEHSSVVRKAKSGHRAAECELCGTDFMSNDILAIEYLRAIKKLNAKITPLVHKRIGAGYLCEDASAPMASASAIRRLVSDRNISLTEERMPSEAFVALSDTLSDFDLRAREERLFSMIASKFSFSDAETLSSYAFLSGGLAGRMKKATARSSSLEEFYNECATKVYTNGRIRRASICAVCEIKASALLSDPEYMSLLALSAIGREYLSKASFDVEICSSVQQKKKYPSFEFEERFDTLYSLLTAKKDGERCNYSNRRPYVHQS